MFEVDRQVDEVEAARDLLVGWSERSGFFEYHLFLSYCWGGSGQANMRVIKDRLTATRLSLRKDDPMIDRHTVQVDVQGRSKDDIQIEIERSVLSYVIFEGLFLYF